MKFEKKKYKMCIIIQHIGGAMYKFLFIAPYEGLQNLMIDVNKGLNNHSDIFVGNLYDGLEIAKRFTDKDYDVIISRGATARLIRQYSKIPVVEIKITGYDILRTLTLVKGYLGKIGMMSYLNTIQEADTIGKLLDMQIVFYPIHTEQEVSENIQKATQEGIEVIIGDVISTQKAEKEGGINSILITSGSEAVKEAIDEATQIARYTFMEKRFNQIGQETMEKIEDGIAFIDDETKCLYLNKSAADMLQTEKDNVINHKLDEQLPSLKLNQKPGEPVSVFSDYIQLKNESVHVHLIPVSSKGKLIGAGAILKKGISYNDNSKSTFRNQAHFHFNQLVGNSKKMKSLIELTRKTSKSDRPILIKGEHGTGRNSFAQAIHNKSDRFNNVYISFNCAAFGAEQLEKELFGFEDEDRHFIQPGAVERANHGTLFLHSVASLPPVLQGKLYHALHNNKVTRMNGNHQIDLDIRILSSDTDELDQKIDNHEFRKDLYNTLAGFRLTIPPLRERMDDLENLIRLFLSSYNTKFGKQVVKVNEDVLSELKQLSWPRNIAQLKNVIDQMCTMSDGPFIEKKDVQPLLTKLKQDEKRKLIENLNFEDKTLEEIEQDIIHLVLQEEDFNQSKAAKRLGINRSTLWRKLKISREDEQQL
ncbi:sigma-54-dependent Fis family transcriptional regulator [Salipaludibacillus keqinensis]|uniref:sigma-54-dependent Fis family transcriptional regulator n=1 Tax=Salipaludibacillus keqinensis TaxID=2045207 RepID=UPI0011AF2C0C|nr:PrpR N-terminal domain-containing protein [Salipaludibacillus keqinensis]